jgi:ribosomal protein S18 acetylase RimI-like enzyme
MDIWELNMEHCKFDMATKNDIDKVLEIYNSNSDFLEKHLGASRVSKEFIANEMEEMKKIGFRSFVIKNSEGNTVGICDFKIAEEVYLSLLMIDGKQKRNGLGSRIYSQLEQLFQAEGADRIRIDVVYEDNVVAFWEKQGFIPCEKIQLEWNGHKSNAIKMVKTISKWESGVSQTKRY